MKTRWILFLCVSFMALSARATGGSEAGNGGSSIVCQDASSNITSVELLDFYEARTQRNIKVDLGPVTNSVETKLALAVQRLERLDPELASRLNYDIQWFKQSSHFYSGIRLVEIPDSQNLFIPKGCQQEQIAIWRLPTVPEDSQYNINQELWDRLDNDNKAGLILHETLYYRVSQNEGFVQASDSRMVRYLVSKISSASANAWSFLDYVNVLRQLHFRSVTYDHHSYAIDDTNPGFLDADHFLGGPLASQELIQLQGKSVLVSSIRFNGDGDIYLVDLETTTLLSVAGQDIWFQKNHELALNKGQVTFGYAIPNSKNVFKKAGFYDLKTKSSEGNPIPLSFDTDGTLVLCRACEGTVFFQGIPYQVTVPNPYVESGDSASYGDFKGGEVRLFLAAATAVQIGTQMVLLEGQMQGSSSTGMIWAAKLAQKTVFDVDSKSVSFAPERIVFYQSGKIQSGTLAEDTVLTSEDGKEATYWAGMQIGFSEKGLVFVVYSSNREKK